MVGPISANSPTSRHVPLQERHNQERSQVIDDGFSHLGLLKKKEEIYQDSNEVFHPLRIGGKKTNILLRAAKAKSF